MGLYQTKNFCTVNENIDKMKRQSTEWDRILAKDKSNNGLIIKTNLGTHTT